MDSVSVNLENKLKRNTYNAPYIILLSIMGIPIPPLYLIAWLYFLLYSKKRKKLKSDQSIGSMFIEVKGKTKKELRAYKRKRNSLGQSVRESIRAYRNTIVVLIFSGLALIIEMLILGVPYSK
jgi:hypothetical protein